MFRKYFRRFCSQYYEKKTRLNGCVYNFVVGCSTFNTNNIIGIHKYLMKKYIYKIVSESIKSCLSDY